VKRPHLVVLALLLLGGFLMCAGFVFVGSSIKRQRDAESTAAIRTVPVVVADVDLPAGTIITDETPLLMKPYPAHALPVNSFGNPEDLRKKLVVRSVARFTPISAHDLSQITVPAGYRAISFKTVLGSAIRAVPGTKVDVLKTVQDPDDAKKTVLKTFLENILILAVSVPNSAIVDGEITTRHTTVTVAVSADEAEKLAAAIKQGEVEICLRRQDMSPIDR
jgi:Flp pilus assembly protein CpaB